MNGELRLSRAFPAALLAALAIGATTAVLASGAAAPGDRVITLRGDANALTVVGSSFGDTLTINGRAADMGMPGTITISGNMAKVAIQPGPDEDCDGTTDVSTARVTASCDMGTRPDITIAMGKGGDSLEAAPGYDGVTIIGKGAAGEDRFAGSTLADRFNGGGGDDNLKGKDGADELNGAGGDKDRCDGGPGQDEIRNCER